VVKSCWSRGAKEVYRSYPLEAATMSKKKQEDPFVSEEVCAERHKRVDEKLDCYEKDIKSINQKINATLVTVIILLVTLLIDISRTGVHI
jgi:hypothetical protein